MRDELGALAFNAGGLTSEIIPASVQATVSISEKRQLLPWGTSPLHLQLMAPYQSGLQMRKIPSSKRLAEKNTQSPRGMLKKKY